MTGQKLELAALCDDLLARLESELPTGTANDVDWARVDGSKTVINAVCDVIESHLFKDSGGAE